MHSSDASNGDQQSQQRAGQLPDFDSGATDRLDCSHGIFAPTLTQHTSHNPSGSDPRNSTPSSIHEKVAHGINIINLCFCNGCVSLLYCVMIHNHVLMRRYDTCRDTRKRQRSPSRSSSADHGFWADVKSLFPQQSFFPFCRHSRRLRLVLPSSIGRGV